MLVHQVHVISRHITATEVVSTILAITEIRSAFHQTMSSTLYQLGHACIEERVLNECGYYTRGYGIRFQLLGLLFVSIAILKLQ